MKLQGWSLGTSWCVALLWSLVSLLVSLVSLSSLTLSTWYINTSVVEYDTAFGVYYWYREYVTLEYLEAVRNHTSNTSLFTSPPPTHPSTVRRITHGSGVWVLVGSVYGGAAIILFLSGMVGPLFVMVLRDREKKNAMSLLSNVQAMAVTLELLSLLLYPLGLGSHFAKDICGRSASVYNSGSCSIGYGYLLAIVSSTISAYCPVLARLVTYRDYGGQRSGTNL